MSTEKIKVGIIGPGNIGSDLMFKVMKSKNLEMYMMAGRKVSDGIKRAAEMGFRTTTDGAEGLAADPDIKIVFDATSAKAHEHAAPILKSAGKIAIDLTPAAVGPYVVPCVNLDSLADEVNFNLVTCGGQAVVPIVFAINRAAGAEYCEIVSCIASKSAGPGTRANIDEFTETTAKALKVVGGADHSKAIIILNPAEPPLIMTNTVHALVKNPNEQKIVESVNAIIRDVQTYVPGYRLRVPPIVDGNKVTVIIEVEGGGDFLPIYSGNLDIINQAAIGLAEKLAARMLGRE